MHRQREDRSVGMSPALQNAGRRKLPGSSEAAPNRVRRHPGRALRALLGAAFCVVGSLGAETLRIPLVAEKPVAIPIDAPLDDTNFQDPIGYNSRGHARHVFNPRITLTNTGTVPLTGRLLIVNGHDWSSPDAVRATLRLPPGPRAFVPRLFAAWKGNIAHADSDTEAGKDPFALRHFWGYGLCGDNATAFARLLDAFGVAARKVQLNGHVVSEYLYDGSWHVFDGDQGVFYLRLDNQGTASAEEIRADPFLARRTKICGPDGAMNETSSAFNTSLFEYVEPKQPKPIKHKSPVQPLRPETLYPGEKLIFHRNRAPDQPVGKADLQAWRGTREDALGMIEIVINSAARRTPAGEIAITTSFPILEVVNHTTGERTPVSPGEPVFQTTLQPRSAEDRVSVFCQRSRVSFPVFRKGENTAVLHADRPDGAALLEVEIERPAGLTAPSVAVQTATRDGQPEFVIVPDREVDRLWWQVATDREFANLCPNFDNVLAPVPKLAFDPLTATFFQPGQDYYLRMKARRDGVWGEWTAPLKFRVEKPARPSPVSVSVVGGRLRLDWPASGDGAEYLLFGSNRRDFLPEPFAAEEIVALRDQRVEKTRPNRNLAAVLAKPTVEITPAFRFYRIIARRGPALSVPSEIIITPAALAATLPPPAVLQTRWTRIPDAAAPNGYRDSHVTTETNLR